MCEITQITDALLEVELAKLREVSAKEAALRAEIADLEAHRKASLNLPEDGLLSVRAVGADVLWQSWIGRNKQRLNMELARLLVEKARMAKQAQKAFGRDLAANDLAQDAESDARREAAKARLEKLQHLMVLNGH